MSSIIDRLKSFFSNPSGDELFSLPDKLTKDIEDILGEEEELVLGIRALSAKYKAPRLIDSNTFFNPFIIFTSSKIVIAKNSSSLNIFREIGLRNIVDHKFDISDQRSSLTLKLYNSSDIITFHPYSAEQTEKVEGSFKKILETFSSPSEKKLFCRYCGEKIPADSNFCSDCGSRL